MGYQGYGAGCLTPNLKRKFPLQLSPKSFRKVIKIMNQMRACPLDPLQYLYFLKRCKVKLYIYCASYTGLQGRTLLGPHLYRTEKLSANVTISHPGQMVTTCLPKLAPLRACPLLHFFLMKLDKPCHPPSAGQHCSPNTAVYTTT